MQPQIGFYGKSKHMHRSSCNIINDVFHQGRKAKRHFYPVRKINMDKCIYYKIKKSKTKLNHNVKQQCINMTIINYLIMKTCSFSFFWYLCTRPAWNGCTVRSLSPNVLQECGVMTTWLTCYWVQQRGQGGVRRNHASDYSSSFLEKNYGNMQKHRNCTEMSLCLCH